MKVGVCGPQYTGSKITGPWCMQEEVILRITHTVSEEGSVGLWAVGVMTIYNSQSNNHVQNRRFSYVKLKL